MDTIAGLNLPRNLSGSSASHADPSPPPSLLLVDDRILERECLIFRLGVAGFRVTAAASAGGWCEPVAAGRPSLILYVCDGHAETRRRILAAILQASQTLPVVVLSPSDAMGDVVEAIEGGARGYISSRSTVEHVVAALRFVLAGGIFVPASSMLTARRADAGPGVEAAPIVEIAPVVEVAPAVDVAPAVEVAWHGNFTAKQVAVIEGIRRGKPNKVIAYELNMCESTVKVHVRNVMRKVKARNRTELAFKATEMSL